MLAEVVAQPDRLAGLIDKLRVQRKRLIQVLRHADVLQHGGQLVAAVLARLLCRRSSRPARSTSAHSSSARIRALPAIASPNCPPVPHACIFSCQFCDTFAYFAGLASPSCALPCRTPSSVRAPRSSSAQSPSAQNPSSAAHESPASPRRATSVRRLRSRLCHRQAALCDQLHRALNRNADRPRLSIYQAVVLQQQVFPRMQVRGGLVAVVDVQPRLQGSCWSTCCNCCCSISALLSGSCPCPRVRCRASIVHLLGRAVLLDHRC